MRHPHAKQWAATPDGICFNKAPATTSLLRRYNKHAARAVSYSVWHRSWKWGEKYRDVTSASLHTDDLLTSDVAFIKQSPESQRWCVDASSLYDSATLPCECVLCV